MSYAPIDTRSLSRGQNSRDTSVSTAISFSSSKRNPQVNGKKSARRGHQSGVRGQGSDYPIIVHCHLCWDWVWQRPQQFLSRLSKTHRILFVEIHAPDENLVTPTARLRHLEQFPNVTLLQMQFPAWRWDDGNFVDQRRRE